MSSEDILLHHYTISPFSEKMRRVLAFKGLPWRSVQVPVVMPKPDLTPLTGGYRKTPVLQMGCDLYCDTKLMCRVLDTLHPAPRLVPHGLEATALMTDRWQEQVLFFHAVSIVFSPKGIAPLLAGAPAGALEALQKDRAQMFSSGGSTKWPDPAVTRCEMPGILAALEAQLHDRPYFHGEQATQPDFSLYTSIWFIRDNSGVSAELDPYPKLCEWAARMAAMADTCAGELTGDEAIARAQASKPRALLPGVPMSLDGLSVGSSVTVNATDYGTEPVQGRLVGATCAEIAIARHDDRAGDVVVHFPPEGFRIAPLA